MFFIISYQRLTYRFIAFFYCFSYDLTQISCFTRLSMYLAGYIQTENMMQYQYMVLGLFVHHVYGLLQNLEPYYKLNHSDSKASLIENTIQCHGASSKMDTCAQECFDRETLGVQCIGFIGHGSGSCTLCQPRNSSSGYTSIVSGNTLYILQKQRKEPDLHISLNNIPGQAKFRSGKSSTVTQAAIRELSGISGKENQATKFQNGGNLEITVSEPDCFCNFINCQGKSISVNLWVKVQSIVFGHIVTPGTRGQGLTVGK